MSAPVKGARCVRSIGRAHSGWRRLSRRPGHRRCSPVFLSSRCCLWWQQALRSSGDALLRAPDRSRYVQATSLALTDLCRRFPSARDSAAHGRPSFRHCCGRLAVAGTSRTGDLRCCVPLVPSAIESRRRSAHPRRAPVSPYAFAISMRHAALSSPLPIAIRGISP